MKVFELNPDFDRYHGIFTWDTNRPGAEEEGLYSLDMKAKRGEWSPLPVYWAKPKLRHANIEYCWSGGYALDPVALQVLGTLLEDCCEFLPLLSCAGVTYHLMNPLVVADCLDREASQYRWEMKYSHHIAKFQFLPELFPDAALFKLPKRVELLTVSGDREPEREFKAVYERAELTGLKFRELWSDQL